MEFKCRLASARGEVFEGIYAADSEARLRLRGRDETDWPVLACALGLACGLSTKDADFFGTGSLVIGKCL